jgi:hypothetical protein
MVVHGYFRQKWGLCGHWSSTRGSYTSPHICFLAIYHILGFLVETISWSKIHTCWPSVLLKMVVDRYFRQKMCVVWPLINDQRPIHLTPHIFPCHRSRSWTYGGDHFLVKKIRKMVVHGYFRQKWGLCGNWSSTKGSYTSPHICLLSIDQILGYLVETISWSKIRRC